MLLSWPTWLIDAILFAAMLGCNELGFRYGSVARIGENDLSRAVSGTFKASVFGLVSLLLGFSFSSTTTRYEMRKRLALDQSNAISNCYLRAGLLDEPVRGRMREILKEYVELRLDARQLGSDPSTVDLDRRLNLLWSQVEEAGRLDPQQLRDSQIVPATNLVIDLSSTRAWASQNHLPTPVLVLLVVAVMLSSTLLGHSSGQTGKRHILHWVVTNLIFALVMYVIFDFDRPRRGFVRVDQTPLVEVLELMRESPVPVR